MEEAEFAAIRADVSAMRADVAALRSEFNSRNVSDAVLEQRFSEVEKDLAALEQHVKTAITPLPRFVLVEKAVYGLIGLVLVAVVTAVLAGVVPSVDTLP